MLEKTGKFVWALGVLSVMGGCAKVDPLIDFEQVEQRVIDATGQARVYQPADDALVAETVEGLLENGLTAGEAVEICLLNNPSLQAAFMTVGMSRADAVQAGLYSNPFLSISALLPDGGGLANIQSTMAQNIAELWQVPVRKRVAERSLDAAIVNLARTASMLAADAKSAYYEAVGSDGRLRIAQENLVITRNLLELTLTRQKAGAANELEVNLSRSVAVDSEIAVERSRLLAGNARRNLAIVLGLVVDANGLILSDPLPGDFPETPDTEPLVELAKLWRLDLQAAQQVVHAAQSQVEYQYRLIVPSVKIGFSLERAERARQPGRDILADTARSSIANGGLTAPGIQPRSERQNAKGQGFIIGPSFGVTLPIFDQNQAQIAKAQFALQQASKTLDGLDRTITQEVRSTVDRAMTAWRLMQMYRDQSVPLAQSNLDLSREAYREGRASFLSVLEAQRFFLETRQGYIQAAQSAAMMIPELERSIGLPFDRFHAELNNSAESLHDMDGAQDMDNVQNIENVQDIQNIQNIDEEN
ncbi:MAG: TolC family protein [Planctomycetes bacterium]|nr:TolC family protein [Planctomycetota bacterium]